MNNPEVTKPRVLTIDDERGIRESVRFALNTFCFVSTADSVTEGIRLLELQQYDLIVLDLKLPEIDGIEGLKMIRQIDQDVAIMILTAFGSLETAQEAVRQGANDYQMKPFDLHTFTTAAKKCLEVTTRNRMRTEAFINESKRASSPVPGQCENHPTYRDVAAPLRSIGMQVEMIRNRMNSPVRESKDTGTMLNQRLQSISQSLKISQDFLRAIEHTNADETTIQSIDLNYLIRDVELLIQPECTKQRTTLKPLQAPRQYSIAGNRVLLLRSIYNLMNQAFRTGQLSNTALELRCTKADEDHATLWIVYEHEDASCQITDSLKPATQGDAPTEITTELRSIQSIIEAHHGMMEANYNGRVTTLKLTFPIEVEAKTEEFAAVTR